MSKQDIATIEFRRTRNTYKIYFKSELCEEYFKNLSNGLIGEVPDRSGSSILYSFYKLNDEERANLPYSVRASHDILNYYGWMRAVGVGDGIEIASYIPIIGSVPQKLVERVEQNLLMIANNMTSLAKPTEITRYRFVQETA